MTVVSEQRSGATYGGYGWPVPDRDLQDAMLEVIRERMEGDGVSGNRLSQMSGIGQTTLAGHLRGRGTPTLDDLDAIAGALQTTLEALLEAARRRV